MTTVIRCVGKSIFSVLMPITFFSIFIYSACPPQQAKAETSAAKDIGLQRDAVISKIQAGDSSQAQAAIEKLEQDFVRTIWLQRDDVISKIQAGDNSQAQAAFDKLQQDFSEQNQASKTICDTANEYRRRVNTTEANELYDKIFGIWAAGHNQISQVICETADEYQKQGNPAKADELYKKILSDWPDGSHAVWAKMHLVISDIKKGNASFTQADIDSLMANSSDRNAISQAICEIADEYRKQGNIDKADELYRKILDSLPDSSHAIWAKTYLIASDIQNGNVSAAQTGIEDLTANFSSKDQLDPSFNFAVLGLAEKCYEEGAKGSYDSDGSKIFLEKAVELLDGMAKEDISDSLLKATVFYVKGLSYQAAEDYAQAADSYQQAFETNPKHEYADYFLFASGRCYENLLIFKLIPEEEAKIAIKTRYDKLLNDYPQSGYAPLASKWLANNQ